MNYRVEPGLYALGGPGPESPVFVSANYKMSFDRLRASLEGLDGWILVLDTQGINVWCAAGKGTFGTRELLRQIEASGLSQVVSHRRLIVPQLGAPGVAAHVLEKLSGFTVKYGPVKAEDLPAFLAAGGRATPAMRLKTFSLGERAVLIPIELLEALKPSLLIVPLLYLSAGIGGPAGFWENAAAFGPSAVLLFLAALLAGTVIHPLLLPCLPGRAFSVKGLWLGLIVAGAALSSSGADLSHWPGRLALAAWLLIVPAVTSYLAMNFTGCSTYTSLSGVKREMRWALPLQIAMAAAGIVLWTGARLAW